MGVGIWVGILYTPASCNGSREFAHWWARRETQEGVKRAWTPGKFGLAARGRTLVKDAEARRPGA